MQITPTSTVNTSSVIPGTTSSSSTTSSSTTGTQALTQQDFLQLLAAQMQAQDPLSPMSDTEFVSQMATFTSLQTMSNLDTSFNSFATQEGTVDATHYLGKTVTVTDPTAGSVTGAVTGLNYATGTPQIIVNGTSYDPSAITNIQSSSTATTSSTTSNP